MITFFPPIHSPIHLFHLNLRPQLPLHSLPYIRSLISFSLYSSASVVMDSSLSLTDVLSLKCKTSAFLVNLFEWSIPPSHFLAPNKNRALSPQGLSLQYFSSASTSGPSSRARSCVGNRKGLCLRPHIICPVHKNENPPSPP